jgi:TRAP-type C4-dicarboxylate transport system substrate-binding protein
MRARLAAVVVLTAVGLATAGCTGGPAAKAGEGTATLRFATVGDSINPTRESHDVSDFVDEVSRLSDGRLHINFDLGVGNGGASGEADLLKSIQHGTYDGGWDATRAFAPAGFGAFDAVEAPLVIQSYPVEQQFVTSVLADHMMRRLYGTGLVGLGIMAGPLRRPFAVARPLLEPSDWAGITFRIENSPVQLATVAALGAKAVVTGTTGFDAAIRGPSAAGGQEFDLFQYDRDGFANAEPYVTANVVLWPKPYALVMNAKRFASLTKQQQQWVRQAAKGAVHESATSPFNEDSAVQRLCLTGLRFSDATPGQLAELHAAIAPVYDQLRRDPTTARDLEALKAMEGTNKVSEPTVPSTCRGTAPTSSVVDANIKTLPQLPDGSYRVSVTASDLERYGAEPGHAADNAGTSTLTIRRGTYALRIIFAADPKGRPEPAQAGSVRGTAHTLVFIPRCPAGASCGPVPPPYSFGYKFSHGTLTMTAGAGLTDPISLGTFASHPWLRIR